jgi:hypothetical protein
MKRAVCWLTVAHRCRILKIRQHTSAQIKNKNKNKITC